jgi:hypothetical protein
LDFSLSTSSFSRSERTSRSSASLRTPAALAFARASSHAASLAASAAVASSSCLRRAEASRAVSREAPAKLRAVRRETSVAAVPGRLPGSNPPSFKSASGKSPKGPFVANREAVDVTDMLAVLVQLQPVAKTLHLVSQRRNLARATAPPASRLQRLLELCEVHLVVPHLALDD